MKNGNIGVKELKGHRRNLLAQLAAVDVLITGMTAQPGATYPERRRKFKNPKDP